MASENQSQHDTDELHHHPKNVDFYGEPDDVSAIVADIHRNGFSETNPIDVVEEPRGEWPANRIVSGHRRHEAAQEAGLDEVPVRYVDFDNETEELEHLLRENNYRQKTDGHRIEEGRWYEEQIRTGTIEADGRVTDVVGEYIGMSRRSYEKGREVAREAENGNEIAMEEWTELKAGSQSIHGAHTMLEDDDEDVGKVDHDGNDTDGDDDVVEFSHDGVPYQLKVHGDLADWARQIHQHDGEDAVRDALREELL